MTPPSSRWRWIGGVAARVVLGGVFLYAGGSKIVDPPGFAHELSNYRLLPDAAVAPIALALPWLEVLCGALLVAGIWRREAALLLAGLLVVFVAALSIDLARGIAVYCGCFGGAKPARSPSERFADMRLAIVRDVLLLILAAPVLFRGQATSNPPAESREMTRRGINQLAKGTHG